MFAHPRLHTGRWRLIWAQREVNASYLVPKHKFFIHDKHEQTLHLLRPA